MQVTKKMIAAALSVARQSGLAYEGESEATVTKLLQAALDAEPSFSTVIERQSRNIKYRGTNTTWTSHGGDLDQYDWHVRHQDEYDVRELFAAPAESLLTK